MQIVIELSEKELKKLSEMTDVEIDVDEPDDEDVSDAIKILLNNL
jgi:hypothetical protein